MTKTKDSTSDYRLAVVILNYNGLTHLQKYLESVRENIPDYAVLYIADNGSTDESVLYLRKKHPEIPLILLPENKGFAGGYNEALQQIDTEYYFLVNSDVELTPDTIRPLIEFLDSNPKYAACQPKIRSLANRDYFEYAGACGGWLDRYGYPFCRGRILGTNEMDLGQYDQIEKIFWATGAALMIRSESFRTAGGFDPDFFAHMEEIDLCWRLHRLGFFLAVVPVSVIYHLGGGTLSYSSPRKTFLNFRNSLYILLKNEQGRNLVWMIPFRLILDGIAGIRFALLADGGNLLAVIKAHLSFYRNFTGMWRKRTEFKQFLRGKNIEEQNPTEGRFKGSIIWNYFVLGNKKFTDLGINETQEKQL